MTGPSRPAARVALPSHLRPLVAALLLATVAGCASGPGTLEAAIAEYDAGRYDEANTGATKIMLRTSGSTHDEATYLAGVSAYRLGRLDEAERRLAAAAESDDARTAANARAGLGLVRLDQHRPAEAAALFEAAARDLDEEDAREAARRAATAHRLAGNPGAARTWTDIAALPEPFPDDAPYAGTAAGVFAIQIGAFQERSRANRAVAQARGLVGRSGFGPARVIPRRDGDAGRSLYVVQFGRFQTRREAAAIRDQLGRLDFIVAPYADAG
jgi:tetratricopeptide (TPR) repeat protein